MITLLALGQQYDRPSVREVTLKDMGKTQLVPHHNKVWTVCIISMD